MSLKENVSYIQEEMSTEEKFFENFFKVEKLYKKYKIVIFTLAILVIGFIVINLVKNYTDEQNLIKSNQAYNKILLNPKDKQSIEVLKQSNKKLLEIALLQTSQNKTMPNSVEFLKEIAQYNKAIANNDITALNQLILNPDFLLKDFALFNKALILTNKNQYQKAKDTLNMIPDNSPVVTLSNMLKHYLLTK